MTATLERGPAGSPPLVIGDLNSDLDFPRDRQEEILRVTMRGAGNALRLALLLSQKDTED